MKNMFKMINVVSILALTSGIALAGDRYHEYEHHDRYDKARVTHVEPIYRMMRITTPQRECWQEPRHHHGQQSYTTTIASGIIGGVLGNQFGNGSGRTAMTVAGTLLGGSVGRDLGHDARHYDSYEEQCRVTEHVHHEQRIEGYHVTYRYHGQLYSTDMAHHPGKFVPVDVYVEPRRHY